MSNYRYFKLQNCSAIYTVQGGWKILWPTDGALCYISKLWMFFLIQCKTVCQLIDASAFGRECVGELFENILTTISQCLDSFCQQVIKNGLVTEALVAFCSGNEF